MLTTLKVIGQCTSAGVPELQYFQDYTTKSDEFTIKLYFNIINDDNGNGGYEQSNIPNIITAIESGFNDTGIHFEYVCDVQPIDDSDLVDEGTGSLTAPETFCIYEPYTHSDGVDIFINKISTGTMPPGRVNSIPGNYLVIQENTSTTTNIIEGTTVVHELGHIFGLMHMHRGQNNIPDYYPSGYCGNYSGEAINLNQCTDFECVDAYNYLCGIGYVQDESACAEHRAGLATPNGGIPGNGKIAGDLIPDTPPSHSEAERSLAACNPDNSQIDASGTFPPGNQVYSWIIKDISGAPFQPDITNYMSTLKDKTCRNHFTQNQIAVMKNHIRSHPLLLNFHSNKGKLACDCDYDKIIYLRNNDNWSDVIIDQNIDLNQLDDYEIVVEESLTFDTNYKFTNATFTMGDNANIIVEAGNTLTIEDGTFSACGTRWGEIYLEGGANLDFLNVDMSMGTNAIRTENNFGNNNVAKSEITVHASSIDDMTESGITIQTNSMVSLQGIDITNVTDYGIDLIGSVDAEVLIGINIDGADRGIRVFNSQYWHQVNDCTFTNCHIGVRYNGASGSIHDSDFGKTNFGVTVHNSAHSYIYRNNIGYAQNGITVSRSSDTNINRNNIGLPQDHGNYGIRLSDVSQSLIEGNPSIYASKFGIRGDLLTDVDVTAWRDDNNNVLSSNNISIFGTQNTNSGGILFTGAESCNITDNFINASEVAVGIELNNSPDNTIRNNYVDISSTLTLFHAAAIRNMGSIDMTVRENETHSSNNVNGILAQNSAIGIYECNFIHGSFNGLEFGMNSTDQYIRANRKFNPQNFDFVTRSRLGFQVHLGNKYHVQDPINGGSVRAFMSTDDVGASKFFVEDNTLAFPPDRIPGGTTWYEVGNGQDDDICAGNIGPGGTGTFFSNPVKLCEYWDDIKTLKITDPQLFLIKVAHIINYFNANPLMAIPDCIGLDPIFINLCGIHELMDVVDRITKVGQIDPSRSALITASENMRQLQREYDGLTNPISKENKYTAIKNLHTQSKPAFDQEASADYIEIQNIKTALGNVNCSQYMIQVIKDAWTVYLDELEEDLLDTNPRLASNINTISRLCSDEFGDAVHLARSIALSQGSDIYYDTYDGCRDNDFTQPRTSDLLLDVLELSVAPNPTSGRVYLQFNESVSGLIQVYDMNGSIILSEQIVENGSKNLLINNNGVYILKFIHDNGTILSKKIIVIN